MISLIIGNGTIQLKADIYFRAYPRIDFQSRRITFRHLFPRRTLRDGGSDGGIIGGAFVSARKTERVILRYGITEKQIEPIGITVDHLGYSRIELRSRQFLGIILSLQHLIAEIEIFPGIRKSRIEQIFRELHPLTGVHQIKTTIIFPLVDRDRSIVSNLCRAVTSFLGRNDDNAIGCLYTVYSCCRSVFQHGNTLDVIGIDPRNRITDKVLGIFGQRIEVTARVPVDTVIVENNPVEYPQRRRIPV